MLRSIRRPALCSLSGGGCRVGANIEVKSGSFTFNVDERHALAASYPLRSDVLLYALSLRVAVHKSCRMKVPAPRTVYTSSTLCLLPAKALGLEEKTVPHELPYSVGFIPVHKNISSH